MKFFVNNVWFVVFIGLSCLFLFFIICRMMKNTDHKKRIMNMSSSAKRELFDRVIKPFGYAYDECQELFITRIHAWQRQFGYEKAFDNMAVSGSMVFHCYPIYFDYMEKTWLLEFWKGQYGIACGCEIGLYHADRIVAPEEYKKTHFDSVSDEEIIQMGIQLDADDVQKFAFHMHHWWLGGFQLGVFHKPEELRAVYRIGIDDPFMMQAMISGIRKSGYPKEQIDVYYNRITFHQENENALILSRGQKLYRSWVLWKNHQLVRLFVWYTRPFENTRDRVLYLYVKMPLMLRWFLHRVMRGGKKSYGLSKKTGARI